ncbi:hypothetical protein [Pseudomonas phage PA1C]|uniref:Uncharacterized protein n=1 Tax=Pseudomonas phage vB_PaeM_PS119XW TaxID=2601632 RepID=A0A5C1K8X4_9CAUD|nr:hypothetical protein PP933_gp222 [Pseudomonas phage vB_PaeM_PS119XW]QBX32378.1 hypothetical protein [Pseudomonas phage PA1C]QEM41951.1 hypothetical protein [Pseudomonas phage vB_PaeM_PS119XW]BEG72467.1 hypothetical protein RVBP21_0950 [Pseudomonas phage BRkr]
MSETLSVKRYIQASEIDDTLSDYIGRTFIVKRNGITTAVTLDKVKTNKIYLKRMGDRQDGFSLPRAEFGKYYQLAP